MQLKDVAGPHVVDGVDGGFRPGDVDKAHDEEMNLSRLTQLHIATTEREVVVRQTRTTDAKGYMPP